MKAGHDPLDLKAKDRSREEAEAERRLKRQEEINDVLNVMNTESGRRFVWRLLDKAGVFRSSFTGNSETFFREGMRNLGLMVIGDLHEVCPELYLLMTQEQQKYGKRDADVRTSNH